MKIVVCVKQVPDSAAKLVAIDGKANWGDSPLIINPWDEYAVEAALQQAEAHNGTVIAVTIGGEGSKEALKHALAMGCAEAILVSDESLVQIDSQVTARVLAATIKKIGEVDLAFLGRQAIDTDTGLTAAQTARLLGWPALTLVSVILGVDPSARTIKVEKSAEEGRLTVSAKLPAVLSIIKDFGEPRYPSFMGIRKASRAVIPAWSLADLGISGLKANIAWPEIMNPPVRQVATEMITGSTPEEIAEILADKIMAEKIL
ncbi:MAG TPA: electron transfer flavoprotein subunit beta/FixA family protein [Anaerolineales bacterium]|nr:electron transfer flavoprotein subunit beta/FixA family protein [Anaerolineales bacterium]